MEVSVCPCLLEKQSIRVWLRKWIMLDMHHVLILVGGGAHCLSQWDRGIKWHKDAQTWPNRIAVPRDGSNQEPAS